MLPGGHCHPATASSRPARLQTRLCTAVKAHSSAGSVPAGAQEGKICAGGQVVAGCGTGAQVWAGCRQAGCRMKQGSSAGKNCPAGLPEMHASASCHPLELEGRAAAAGAQKLTSSALVGRLHPIVAGPLSRQHPKLQVLGALPGVPAGGQVRLAGTQAGQMRDWPDGNCRKFPAALGISMLYQQLEHCRFAVLLHASTVISPLTCPPRFPGGSLGCPGCRSGCPRAGRC